MTGGHAPRPEAYTAMISSESDTHPVRALLCTIPLDIGIPRGVTNEPSRLVVMTSNLPVIPKIAIVSLVKWMEKHGYTRDEWDFFDIDMLDPTDEEIRTYFRTANATVIGFSATVSTTYGQVKRIAALAREECPDAWLVLGGSLSASARVVLYKTAIDICVQGDGEIPWVQFLDYTKRYGRAWQSEELAKIKGLTYLDSGREMQFNGYPDKIPAAENPFPDYDVLKVGLRTRPETFVNYFREGRFSCWFQFDSRSHEPRRRPKLAALWTTKGCVVRCTFCQRSTRGYQVNNVTSLDEHLAHLREVYDVGFININDENFGSDKKHAYEIARAMKRHDMLWICGGVRCVSVNEDDVKFYKEHGCCGLKFGIESGSQKILDLMEKNFTVENVYDAVRHCYKHNVYSPIAVMTGMPGETDETAAQTGRFLGALGRMSGVMPEKMGISIFYALPLPGTPLYEYGQQIGVIGTSADDEEKYLLAISDRNADKGNYININGATLKPLLFWDFLIRYEATREFVYNTRGTETVATVRMQLQQGVLPTEVHGVDNTRLEIERTLASAGSMAYRSLNATRVSLRQGYSVFHPYRLVRSAFWYARMGATLLNHRLVASTVVARLPRRLVYQPMRNLVYAEFVATKGIRWLYRKVGRYVEPRSLFNDYKFPKPITDEMFRSTRRLDRSIRTIVKQQREALPQPITLTDRNQRILVQGR
jgi:anaerobic magnesium-protoporphyrin IX monomethyl ester cyclase